MDKQFFTKNNIDLHCHLDGAITSDMARKLASVQNIDIPQNNKDLEKLLRVSEDCTNLNEFLACFDFPKSLLQTKKGLSEAVYLVLENMKRKGIIYAEIRFAPQLHKEKGMSQEDAVLAAIDGLKKSDVKANLILCCMRGIGLEKENFETIELAKKYLVKDGGVVAVDLAGAEALFPTSGFANLFEKVREYGIPYTIHAGEASGPDSVRSALEFGTKRIGHGVRILEDSSLLSIVKEKGIFLEMCPTSNKQTCALDDMSKYPVADFLKRGIKVTINTDDPGIEGTDISREYEYLEKEYGFTSAMKIICLMNSIDAAFTSDDVKQQLRKMVLSD